MFHLLPEGNIAQGAEDYDTKTNKIFPKIKNAAPGRDPGSGRKENPMKKVYHEETPLAREIGEKRRLLHQRHGGIMSPTDVARKAGYYPKPANGDRWAEEHEIPAIRMGPRKRGYETDLVARAIVQSRGMC